MKGKAAEILLLWQTGSQRAQYAVLLSSKALKDHPIIECLRSANIIIIDEGTDFPENLHFDFCTILVHRDSTYNPTGRIPIYDGSIYSTTNPCSSRIMRRFEEGSRVEKRSLYDRRRWIPMMDRRAIHIIGELFTSGTNFCERKSPWRGPIDACDTLLDFAIDRKCFELTELILKTGVEVNTRTRKYANGCGCPLVRAARTGSLKMVKLLLRHGADISTLGVLYAAARSDNLDMVNFFLSQGVSVEDFDPNSEDTALHAAKKSEIARILIANGADVNAPNTQLETPLHTAVEAKNTEVVQLLLENNADVNAQFKIAGSYYEKERRSNALARATVLHANEIIDILIKFGAGCEFEDVMGSPKLPLDLDNAVDRLQAFLDDTFTNFNRERRLEVQEHLKYLVHLIALQDRRDEVEFNTKNILCLNARNIATQIIKIEVAFNSEGPQIPGGIVENVYVDNLKENCRQEIERLKLENVDGTSVPWYKVLTGNLYFVSCLVRNENIAAILKDDATYANFPIYGAAMKSRVSRGSWRRRLLNEGMNILRILITRFNSLPFLLKESIVNQLTNQEILNLEFCFRRKQLRSNVGLPYCQKYVNGL